MSDKPHLTQEQSFHRAATTLPLHDVKAGMKACVMLQDLARVCVAVHNRGEALSPQSLIDWLRSNDFHVEG